MATLTCIKDYSMKVLGCVPDNQCNLPVSFYSCVLPSNLTVSDWASKEVELIAPTADPAGVQPPFDGTFPILDQATFPGFSYWVTAGSIPPVWTDFSVNGLFIQALYVQDTNGSTPHLLRFRGTVLGVPTVIWEGRKTTGENPIGTYMRTGGLSATPECFHVTGPTTPVALAWWSLEGPNPLIQVDSTCGLQLTVSSGVLLDFSVVAGHVVNGEQIACGSSVPGSVTDDVFSCSNTGLRFNGTGVTICGWVNITDTVGDGLNNVGIQYNFDQNGVGYVLVANRQGINGNNWVVTLNGLGSISIASAAGWHFLAITFNGITGNVGFDIDQSGMTTALATIPSAGPKVTGEFILSTHTEVNKVVTVIFDEFAIYNGVLTTAQLNCIYAAGAGRTW